MFLVTDINNQVDFEKVAAKCGYKYGKNARAVFKKVWDRLKTSSTGTGATANGGGQITANGGQTDEGVADDETTASPAAEKTKAKPRATPKKAEKAVKKPATPRKVSAGGPKTPRGRKKSAPKVEEMSTPVGSPQQGTINGQSNGIAVADEWLGFSEEQKPRLGDDTDMTVDDEVA